MTVHRGPYARILSAHWAGCRVWAYAVLDPIRPARHRILVTGARRDWHQAVDAGLHAVGRARREASS